MPRQEQNRNFMLGANYQQQLPISPLGGMLSQPNNVVTPAVQPEQVVYDPAPTGMLAPTTTPAAPSFLSGIEAINKKYEDAVATDAAANPNRVAGSKRGTSPDYTLDMAYKEADTLLKENGYDSIADLKNEDGTFLNLGGALNGIYRNEKYDYEAGDRLDENNTLGPVGSYSLIKTPEHSSFDNPVVGLIATALAPYTGGWSVVALEGAKAAEQGKITLSNVANSIVAYVGANVGEWVDTAAAAGEAAAGVEGVSALTSAQSTALQSGLTAQAGSMAAEGISGELIEQTILEKITQAVSGQSGTLRDVLSAINDRQGSEDADVVSEQVQDNASTGLETIQNNYDPSQYNAQGGSNTAVDPVGASEATLTGLYNPDGTLNREALADYWESQGVSNDIIRLPGMTISDEAQAAADRAAQAAADVAAGDDGVTTGTEGGFNGEVFGLPTTDDNVVSRQLHEAILREMNNGGELTPSLIEEYERYTGEAFDPNSPPAQPEEQTYETGDGSVAEEIAPPSTTLPDWAPGDSTDASTPDRGDNSPVTADGDIVLGDVEQGPLEDLLGGLDPFGDSTADSSTGSGTTASAGDSGTGDGSGDGYDFDISDELSGSLRGSDMEPTALELVEMPWIRRLPPQEQLMHVLQSRLARLDNIYQGAI